MSYNISTKLLNTEQPNELSHLSGLVIKRLQQQCLIQSLSALKQV